MSLFLKRTMDVIGALIVLVITVPIVLVIAISIYFTMGHPVLFRQLRPGLEGEPFTIYKFRTMLESHDSSGRLLPDEKRVTRLGKFLRKTSLDELPELFNVLLGNMSLVGPRPLRMEYLDRYTADQARRHNMRPGITGWAQVHGRNALSWEERFGLDTWYIDNWSLLLDLKILMLTPLQLAKTRDVDHPGHVGMPSFLGSQSKGDIK